MRNLRTFVVLFMVAIGALAASAQSSMDGEFKLASATRWGQAVLPPGDYMFHFDLAQYTMLIRSVDGKNTAFAGVESTSKATPDGSYILITGSGADRRVSAMNLPQFGFRMIFYRPTPQESEGVNASLPQAVPIQLARK